MFSEYKVILLYLFFCFAIVALLLICSLFLVKQNPDIEKFSSYECGFNPYEDARMKFEVRFFLVGLLFIVFDLEVAFLLPWILIFKINLSLVGLLVFIFFLFCLVFSFFFEWWKGALNWE